MKIKKFGKYFWELSIKCKSFLKSLKDPCKNCIVKASCNRKMMCEILNEHKTSTDQLGTMIMLLFILCISTFALVTICLGIYQWAQIFKII
ncbi:MAG: hypothetical protein ACFFG0_04175 [Candidatus Thorarchaeota archaeon]